MYGKSIIYVALIATLSGFVIPTETPARGMLVIGSTDQLWPIAPDVVVEQLGWIEVGAQRAESIHPLPRGLVLIDTSTAHIAPFFLEPDFNLSVGYDQRGGWERTRIGERDKQFFRALDGDISTFYFFAGEGYGNVFPTVDLGGIFPVNRIVFYTHPDRVGQYANVFSLFVNDGDPTKIDTRGNPLWDEVRKEDENKDPLVETLFLASRPVRYVSILPRALTTAGGTRIRPKPWEIAEFEIYGEGFVPEATYISEIIDISQVAPQLPGEQASWGKLHWIGSKDENARVVIRTRTGSDDDPNIYWWNTGRGNELSTLKVDGTPLSFRDYERVPNTQRGDITYDTQNWSFWSPPYDFERGLEGVSISSPGPRRYIQVRIDFISTITDGSRIENIGFDFSKPPSALSAVAEIFPREVPAAVDTVFTYFLRPSLGESDFGFDSLEIDTFVRSLGVYAVRIEGESVDLTAYPPEILDDRLVVHFPRIEAKDTQKLIEVEFGAQVVKFGTEFQGRIFDQQSDEVRQRVDGGDATNLYSGGGIAVNIPFIKQLISTVEVTPSLFTPNGDNINDQTRISYALLNLTEKTAAALIIYDLSGRRVRQLQDGQLLSGSYEWTWDGQDTGGQQVPPGHYIYQVTVESDNGTENRSGILSVVY
jgi:gliding motility-associated-like protein